METSGNQDPPRMPFKPLEIPKPPWRPPDVGNPANPPPQASGQALRNGTQGSTKFDSNEML